MIKTVKKVLTLGLTLAVVGSILVSAPAATAAASVSPATGGEGLAQGSGFVTLSFAFINESAAGEIGVGTHTINLPSGWEFDTSSQVKIATNSSVMVISPTSLNPGANSFSFQVQSPSVTASSISIQDMRVRPTGSTNGNITHGGASIAGVTNGVTSFGSLSVQGGTDLPGGSGIGAGGSKSILAPPDNVSIKIENGAETTDSRWVTLNLSADRAGDMIITNGDDFGGGKLEPYTTTKQWQLSKGDGEKKVSVKFRSSTGLYAAAISDTIILNEKATPVIEDKPVVTPTFKIDPDVNDDGYVNTGDVIAVVSEWGTRDRKADITQDKTVDVSDFNAVIVYWSDLNGEKGDLSNNNDARLALDPETVKVSAGERFTVRTRVLPGDGDIYTVRMVLDYPADILTLTDVKYNGPWMPLILGSENSLTSASTIIRTAGYPGGVDNNADFADLTFVAKRSGNGTIAVNDGSVTMDRLGRDRFSDQRDTVSITVTPLTTLVTAPTTPTNNEPVVEVADNTSTTTDEESEERTGLLAQAGEFFGSLPGYILIILIIAGLASYITSRRMAKSFGRVNMESVNGNGIPFEEVIEADEEEIFPYPTDKNK